LVAATGRSSYEAMRQREDAVARGSEARIMHSGKVSGWREWMTPELASLFHRPDLTATAAIFGYEVAPNR